MKISPPNTIDIFLKLNSNILAIVYEKNAIELIDIIKRQIVKKITLFEILDECDDISGLSLADSKTMIMYYCHDLRRTVAQYKIKDNDIEFFSKREGIPSDAMSIVRKSKEGKLLVTDYYDGKLTVYL